MSKKIKYPVSKLPIIIPLLALFISSNALAVDLSSQQKQLLRKGKTVVQMLPTSGKKGFYGGSGYKLINAPIDTVWDIIQQWNNYSRMFPNTDYCKTVSRKGNRTLLKMKIGHPVVSVQYHVETVADDSKYSLRFNLVSKYPHDIDSMKGYWRLFPQPGDKTLAVYVVSVKAPAGIVAIAGDDLANAAAKAMLEIPGDVNRWIKKNKLGNYRK